MPAQRIAADFPIRLLRWAPSPMLYRPIRSLHRVRRSSGGSSTISASRPSTARSRRRSTSRSPAARVIRKAPAWGSACSPQGFTASTAPIRSHPLPTSPSSPASPFPGFIRSASRATPISPGDAASSTTRPCFLPRPAIYGASVTWRAVTTRRSITWRSNTRSTPVTCIGFCPTLSRRQPQLRAHRRQEVRRHGRAVHRFPET